MNPYRRILLVVDPSMRRTPAFDRALGLAKATGAELCLCLFDYMSAVSVVGVVSAQVKSLAQRAFISEREDWLRDLALELQEDKVKVRTAVVWGSPIHERIVDKVLELNPDLVIKDVHLESALKRVVFTPLDWHLLRLCPAPLLLVTHVGRDFSGRIVAAVDPMRTMQSAQELDDRVVQAAIRLATQGNGELHLAHAFGGLPQPAAAGTAALEVSAAYDQLRLLHRQRFQEFARRHAIPAERAHMIDGLAHRAIADLASELHAKVVVLGTIHRTGLQRILIGSTAERILNLLSCDVLAVKPDGFATDLAHYLGRPAIPGAEAESQAAAKDQS
jgi:universal stress protein E